MDINSSTSILAIKVKDTFFSSPPASEKRADSLVSVFHEVNGFRTVCCTLIQINYCWLFYTVF